MLVVGNGLHKQPAAVGGCAGDVLVSKLDSINATAASVPAAALVVKYNKVGEGEKVTTASPAAADDHGGRGSAEQSLVVRSAHHNVAMRLGVLQLPHNLKYLARLARGSVAGALDAAGLPDHGGFERGMCSLQFPSVL